MPSVCNNLSAHPLSAYKCLNSRQNSYTRNADFPPTLHLVMSMAVGACIGAGVAMATQLDGADHTHAVVFCAGLALFAALFRRYVSVRDFNKGQASESCTTLSIAAVGGVALHCAVYFSNSFVVWEDAILRYILATLLLLCSWAAASKVCSLLSVAIVLHMCTLPQCGGKDRSCDCNTSRLSHFLLKSLFPLAGRSTMPEPSTLLAPGCAFGCLLCRTSAGRSRSAWAAFR